MSDPTPAACDECGRHPTSIHRIHRGRRFCGTCYARVFKRRLCPQCGEVARLPRTDPEAVCRRCTRAKPCVRCGKTEYRAGKITPYGPACNACAPHFRTAEPCQACGQFSGRLTRVTRLGHDLRLCPRCARVDHGTCAACRRHRLLVDAADGRRLCRTCRENADIPCRTCGKPMPAGRGNTCEGCYWRETAEKRIRMDQTALSNASVAAEFGRFGAWLIGTVGPQKAALRIHSYLSFFVNAERSWKRIPGYEELLSHFGAEGLRRIRLPMRWLKETRGLEADPTLQQAHSERRRIEGIVASVPPATQSRHALEAYRMELMQKLTGKRASLRSIRLALRPAASLLVLADATGDLLPSQAALDRYLTDAPGQKAAVTGFVNFLRRRYGIELQVRADSARVANARRKELERTLVKLARLPHDTDGLLMRWIATALEYFHGLRPQKKDLRSLSFRSQDNGIAIDIRGKTLWIPGHERHQSPLRPKQPS